LASKKIELCSRNFATTIEYAPWGDVSPPPHTLRSLSLFVSGSRTCTWSKASRIPSPENGHRMVIAPLVQHIGSNSEAPLPHSRGITSGKHMQKTSAKSSPGFNSWKTPNDR
jgi:hypothetical protein